MSLQWRLHCRICRQLCKGEVVPFECVDPEECFVTVMGNNPNFGRYAVFIVWLQKRLFPVEGERVWRDLCKKFPHWQFSFCHLLGRWMLYLFGKYVSSN